MGKNDLDYKSSEKLHNRMDNPRMGMMKMQADSTYSFEYLLW